MKFKLGTKVLGIKKEGNIVKVDVESAKGGKKETVIFFIYQINQIIRIPLIYVVFVVLYVTTVS